VDGNPAFVSLYQRIAGIAQFDTRLARFTHLENVSRTFDFYTVPERFYSEEGKKGGSGPLSGLTYLVFGQRYHRLTTPEKKTFEADLGRVFPGRGIPT